MRTGKAFAGIVAAVVAGVFAAGSAQGSVSATGSVTAVPDGPNNFLYTVTLNNTGTTNIDTLWFGWLPDNYDFLTSVPTPTKTPANWASYVESGYYGSSIEFYDTGSSPIGMGQSSSSFQFTSPDSPDVIGGDNELFPFPETYSYVYSSPPAGPGQDPDSASSVIFSMPVAAPEPTGLAVIAIGGAMTLLGSRRRAAIATVR
jgi:hypothetical protein